MINSGTYCPFDLVSDPSHFGLVSKTAKTSMGEVHFVCSPMQTSETVTLFLHGVGGSWVSWTPILQAAKAAGVPLGDIFLIDLPGFGSSNRDVGQLEIDQVGDLVVDLAHDEGWQKIVVVGHSMGGFLALNMASRRMPSLAAIDIISGAYFTIIDTVRNPFAAFQNDRAAAVAYLGLRGLSSIGPIGPWLARLAWRLNLMPLALRSTVAHPRQLRPKILFGMSRSVNPSSFLLAAKNGIKYDAENKWKFITIPIKAIFGCEDNLVPPNDARRLQAVNEGAETMVLPEAGHFSHVEQPLAVVDFFFAGGPKRTNARQTVDHE